MTKVDLRYMIAAGLIIFAIGSADDWITRDFDFYELLVPQIMRGVGIMMAMIPVNNIALGTSAAITDEERLRRCSTSRATSAVPLVSRSSIAILDTRTDLHIVRLQEKVH